MNIPQPVELKSDRVTLRPLDQSEAAQYLEIGTDPAIWNFLAAEPFESLSDASDWISTMLARAERSGDVPFSIYDNATGALAGSSSYLDIRAAHGGLEIGYTWYGKAFRRTHINTATKAVLLENAFEILGANRVQLQTDERNNASQKAIARIGATREGVLRKHKIYPDGYVRNSVVYSIVADEWPHVKQKLADMLD